MMAPCICHYVELLVLSMDALMNMVDNIALNNNNDVVKWDLTKNGRFSLKSI
jgi:hypothetical protein